jgi:hypothetical protein
VLLGTIPERGGTRYAPVIYIYHGGKTKAKQNSIRDGREDNTGANEPITVVEDSQTN